MRDSSTGPDLPVYDQETQYVYLAPDGSLAVAEVSASVEDGDPIPEVDPPQDALPAPLTLDERVGLVEAEVPDTRETMDLLFGGV